MADLWKILITERTKSQAWDLYLEQFHYMVGGKMKFEAFSTYYDRITGRNIDTRPDAEILAEVANIRAEFAKEGG